jgi:hypothetical protein
MCTFWTFRRTLSGEENGRRKMEIYLMFYGLIKRMSLLSLTVEKNPPLI